MAAWLTCCSPIIACGTASNKQDRHEISIAPEKQAWYNLIWTRRVVRVVDRAALETSLIVWQQTTCGIEISMFVAQPEGIKPSFFEVFLSCIYQVVYNAFIWRSTQVAEGSGFEIR